jgi:hypothetical protein
VQVFSRIAFAFFVIGAVTWGRFLYLYFSRGSAAGHVQSLLIGSGAIILAFVVGLVAMLAELLAANRRLLEDVLLRVRNLESSAEHPKQLHNVWTTGHQAWRAGDRPARSESAQLRSEAAVQA